MGGCNEGSKKVDFNLYAGGGSRGGSDSVGMSTGSACDCNLPSCALRSHFCFSLNFMLRFFYFILIFFLFLDKLIRFFFFFLR